MPWLVMGAALTVGLVFAVRWLLKADPRLVADVVRRLAGALAIAAGLLLSLRGAVMLGGPLMLAGLGALAPGLLPGGRRTRPSRGGSSAIETAALRMTLDHDSGLLDGEAIAGPHAGRRLSTIPIDALEAWLDELRGGDPDSAALLETYLDRRGGGRSEDRRRDEAGARTSPNAAMSEAEAYAVLGLERGASPQDVRAAHRRLMLQAHPDRGGSSWLAAKINEAKSLILRSLGEKD